MELARVIGRVVCQVKYPTLTGVRLMVIQPVDHDQVAVGDPIVAADPMQAGPGDVVAWIGGREAALALGLVNETQFNEWVRPEDMIGSIKA